MLLTYRPLLLELRHPFRLATGMRTHTQAMLTEIRFGGHCGIGEAAMPPYYGENQDSAAAFLAQAAALLRDRFRNVYGLSEATIADILSAVDAVAPGNNAAKASVDIALHDLWGKMEGRPLWQLLDVDPQRIPPTSFTLGIDSPEILRQKLSEATGFHILKVKLGSEDDRKIIRTVRECSDLPIYADANQGWHDLPAALDLIHWLREQGVLLIEQPVPKDDLDGAAWLSARSPLPVFADESFQRLSDLERVASAYHGVNIKLMKCTGIAEGRRIARAARQRGLQLMVGCMTETSCGISAAAVPAAESDHADIDGCWLIRNNPFDLPELVNGRIVPGNWPGLVQSR